MMMPKRVHVTRWKVAVGFDFLYYYFLEAVRVLFTLVSVHTNKLFYHFLKGE